MTQSIDPIPLTDEEREAVPPRVTGVVTEQVALEKGGEGDPPEVYDYLVIGGGIVGLATAMELLKQRPGASLLVVEKEERVAFHQTGHNSGVIHAGIYYTPGSLKATLCKAGAERTREFADSRGVPYRDVGKLIVATNEDELERLDALFERAQANGLDVEKLDGAELKRREPRVSGIGAIWSPRTGIIDYKQVSRAMAEVIEAGGGRVRLGTKVVDITESLSEVRIDVTPTDAKAVAPVDAEHLFAKQVVVCGGIQADRLARMAGLDPAFRMVPFRGEYYRLPPEKNDIVNSLIYPVPDPSLPFLGVHLTLMMDGGVTVGPNAVMGFAREGYGHWSMNAKDIANFATYKGFWKLVPNVLKTGVVEMKNSAFKPGYLKLVTKYAPELTVSDLKPEPAGIRAQALMEDGAMAEDFLFMESKRMVHVCNAPSPAATSAMPIAEMIVEKVLAD